MPQMGPIMWLYMYIFFLTLFLFFLTLNYFIGAPKKTHTEMKTPKPSLNWKW
uniref:ATP synthase complex subunit 8 n=1 Tax=Saron marmoratus TaxID=1055079 RepID=A0A7G7WQG5_9EUCA|nr:ATP synthase F0 subunit 8 [Saron marmoratus]QNH68792.1 ATP synthase F0 subunit 8 [Saron marmoratus]